MRQAVLIAACVMVWLNAIAASDNKDRSENRLPERGLPILLDARGATYTPLESGYLGLGNGKFRPYSGTDLLIDSHTGQYVAVPERASKEFPRPAR